MNYDKIGNFILEKRKQKNLTQKELASLIGVTDKAVSKWERGQGCPDVSILEVLSKALDVSILELLKGRIIENEVIPVTEMNDYVKETIDYSNKVNQNKTKKIFSKITIVLILIIGIFLIILNINHMVYLNQKESYDFNNDNVIKDMKENISHIEKDIKIIKSNPGIFEQEDHQKIIEHLDVTFSQLKKLSILEYQGVNSFKLIDFYQMDLDYIPIFNTIEIFNILSKYNEEMNDYNQIYKDTWMARAFLGSRLYSETNLLYCYNLVNFDVFDSYFIPVTYRINGRLINYKYQISAYLYMVKNIMKVGEIYE